MKYASKVISSSLICFFVLAIIGCSSINQGTAAYRFGDAGVPEVLDAFQKGMGHPDYPNGGTVACTQPVVAHLCVSDGTSRVDMLMAKIADAGGDYYFFHFRSTVVSPIPWYWPWSNGWVHDYAQQMQKQLGVKAQLVENAQVPHSTLALGIAALKNQGEITKSSDKRAVEPKKDFVLQYEPDDWK